MVPTRSPSIFDNFAGWRLERDGTMIVELVDGQSFRKRLDYEPFESSSAIASSAYVPILNWLHLQTVRGDHILVELPRPHDLAPLDDRVTIYLDQNHWSTLTNAIHDPGRVHADELAAARQLIELQLDRSVVLPISAGHLSETCKQVDAEERYRRGLTMAQLSTGWQLLDPLELRRFELRQAMCTRYRGHCLIPKPAVTLEPNALNAERGDGLDPVRSDFPEEARWMVHSITCIAAIIDTLIDANHVPSHDKSGWADELQSFAAFLRDNPTSKEMKRQRTHAKFIVDLARELPEEAYRAGLTVEEMSDWTLEQSPTDVAEMPTLGLFREILHEKLSDTQLRWHGNDLVDMMYLTAAAGYCDHVVAERTHASHITNSQRRLGRPRNVHRNLRSLVDAL